MEIYQDYFHNPEMDYWDKNDIEMDEELISRLSEEFEFNYVVMGINSLLDFPGVYENDSYILYRLK